MANAPSSTNPDKIDLKTGRLLPRTDEQRKARSAILAQALDAIDEISDDTDTNETWRNIFRSIDEARPDRPLFNGQYWLVGSSWYLTQEVLDLPNQPLAKPIGLHSKAQ